VGRCLLEEILTGHRQIESGPFFIDRRQPAFGSSWGAAAGKTGPKRPPRFPENPVCWADPMGAPNCDFGSLDHVHPPMGALQVAGPFPPVPGADFAAKAGPWARCPKQIFNPRGLGGTQPGTAKIRSASGARLNHPMGNRPITPVCLAVRDDRGHDLFGGPRAGQVSWPSSAQIRKNPAWVAWAGFRAKSSQNNGPPDGNKCWSLMVDRGTDNRALGGPIVLADATTKRNVWPRDSRGLMIDQRDNPSGGPGANTIPAHRGAGNGGGPGTKGGCCRCARPVRGGFHRVIGVPGPRVPAAAGYQGPSETVQGAVAIQGRMYPVNSVTRSRMSIWSGEMGGRTKPSRTPDSTNGRGPKSGQFGRGASGRSGSIGGCEKQLSFRAGYLEKT